MKINSAVALAVLGLLTVFPRLSVAQEDQEKVLSLLQPGALPDFRSHPVANGVEFRSWHQGEPPVKMIRKEEGFCALTSVGGGFAGGGEQAHVYIDTDGYWYLGGKSMQDGVSAECVIVRFAPVPAPKAKRVKILAASYSFGSDYADVTERVRKLVRAGTTFQANPGWLHADPHPYWNKALVIVCKIDHRTAIFSVGENESVSRDLLLEKSRPVADKAATPADQPQ